MKVMFDTYVVPITNRLFYGDFFSLSNLRKRFCSDCAPNLGAVPDHLCASLSNPS